MAVRNRIGEILLRARVIDELQLRSALAQLDQWGGRLGRIVAEMKLASEDTIVETICKDLSLQRAQLGSLTRDQQVLAKVDVSLCQQRGIFPVALRDNGKLLVLAMADPTDLATVDHVAALTRARVAVQVAGDKEIERAIRRLYFNLEATYSNIRDPSEDEEEEAKIVDISGKTVRTFIKTNDSPLDSPPQAAAPAPGARSTATLLDEMLAGAPPHAGLTEEELERVDSVRANQEKSTKILQAVRELLEEKGLLSAQDLAARMRG